MLGGVCSFKNGPLVLKVGMFWHFCSSREDVGFRHSRERRNGKLSRATLHLGCCGVGGESSKTSTTVAYPKASDPAAAASGCDCAHVLTTKAVFVGWWRVQTTWAELSKGLGQRLELCVRHAGGERCGCANPEIAGDRAPSEKSSQPSHAARQSTAH